MPEQGTKREDERTREQGNCPICGQEYEDASHLPDASRDGQSIPAQVFDHGVLTCFEWADGEATQN